MINTEASDRAFKRRQIIIDSTHDLILKRVGHDKDSTIYARIKAQIEALNEEALQLERKIRQNLK
jgi:hypothetical protein